MKIILSTILLLGMIIPQAEPKKITGVYSNMSYSEESGDIGGMEVFIVYSMQSRPGKYYAMVQIAQGVPEVPSLTEVLVNGDDVTFKIGEYGTFKGKITQKELIGIIEGHEETIKLIKGKSFWQKINYQ